ncbi:fibronectin type III domain-containing protein [Saccharolobus solfataricus]|uniref:Fibronectin type III domain-containing protein n=1 Tax=Saccharolobus solfataricus TaxID=2287 RepID=A0A7S9IG86_SACSO|nr:fibronectin type III domain-containing protein [Saccharolobus solfataricus]QPG48601.1 fibronectin type III domain-containing protein [Saccharolobus solfataricus]
MNYGNMKKRRTVILFLSSLLLLQVIIIHASSTSFSVNASYLASLPYPNSHAAVVYYKGSLYVIGGDSNSNQVWIYSNGTWNIGPSLPFNIISPSAVVYNNTIYVIGGYNNSGIIPYVLKLDGNSWVIIGKTPFPAYSPYTFVYNNTIYVIGGENTTSPAGIYFPPSNVVRVFYPSNGSWRIVGYMPIPTFGGGYVFNGTSLIIVSGYIGYSSYTNDILIYNPQNNSWTILNGVLPFWIHDSALAYYRGILFIVGGYIYTAGSGGVNNAIYAYYSGDLHRVGYLPVPVYATGYVQVGNGLYLAGGIGSSLSDVSALQLVTFNFPPLPPKITSYSAGNGSVTLGWNPVKLASGYEIIYWNNMGFNNTINVGNVTSYMVTGLKDGITYYFEVIAYNSIGYSSPSSVVALTPASVPNPPQLGFVKYGNDNVTLSWLPPTFSGGYNVLGYYVIVKNQNSIVSSYFVNSTSLTIGNLTPNVTYNIFIYAVNKLGNSSPLVLTVVPITKASVFAFITKLESGILVNWTTSFPANISLELYDGNGNLISQIASVKGNNSYLFRVPQGNYTLIIAAINSAGISKYVYKIVYYLPPTPPQVSLVGFGNNLYISWSDEPNVITYLVYVNNSLVYEGPSNSIVTNISNGTYLVKVIGVNPAGSSSPGIAIIHYTGDYVTVVKMKVVNVTIVNKIVTAVSGNGSSLSLGQSIVVILLAVMILLSLAIITRNRSSGFEW